MKTQIFTLILALCSQLIFAQTYTNAESVEFDPINNQWLVSNGSRIIADDGNGNLTFFGTGPGNLGLEVLGNTAFVSVQNGIKGYDLTTEAEVMSLTVPGATFLNGLTNDGTSTLYTTEFNSNKIFAIDVSDLNNPIATEIVADTEQTPNGIIYDGANNRLIFTTWTTPARIKAVDLGSNVVSDITTTNVGLVDGIDDDSDGNYYISSWSPDRITKYTNDFSSFETVVTPALDSPADVGYNQASNILAIPVFDDVIFIDLNVLSISDVSSEKYNFGVSSNPIETDTYVQFNLDTTEEVSLTLFDLQGKSIKSLFNEQANGTYKIVLAGLHLEAGLYLLEFKTASGFKKTTKLIVE